MTDGISYESCLESIAEDRVRYERLIPGVTSLIDGIANLPVSPDSDVSHSEIEYRLANLLFIFRCAVEDCCVLSSLSTFSEPQDKFFLQKQIRRYLIDISSTYDYLQQLLERLTDAGIGLNATNTGTERVNATRNQVIHEAIPTIMVNNRPADYIAHSDYAGSIDGPVFQIVFHSLKQEKPISFRSLQHLIQNTFPDCKTAVLQVIDALLQIIR